MATASESPDEPPPRRGRPVVVWTAIVLATATAFVSQLLAQRAAEGRQPVPDVILEMQAREYVALAQIDSAQKAKAYEQAQALPKRSESEKLRFVVLAGELVGPDEALKQLDASRPTAEDKPVAAALAKLYRDYEKGDFAAPSLTAEEQQLLRDKLGWFGELALAPEGTPDAAARAAVLRPALRAFYASAAFIAAALGTAAVGLCLLVGMVVLLALRRVRLLFRTGSPYGGVYAETFALWMWLFLGLGKLGTLLPTGPNRILVGEALAGLSLAALAWPVFRGVPWRTLRRDIGWSWKDRAPQPAPPDDAYAPHFLPRRPASAALEPAFGLASYAATLPLLLVGALLTLGLMALSHRVFGESGGPLGIGKDPSHPIAPFVMTANWWGCVQVLLAAAVGAPIIEETMFRGVLYRHLREATSRWRRLWAVLASAAVNSFIFAVIHPQGLLAVPALMSLAIGFSLAREWRGTLVPSIVAHGFNNLVLTVFLLVSTTS